MPTLTYSVVVPIHNESAHISTLIPQMTDTVAHALGGPQEIWMVENGSTDTTVSEAQAMAELLRSTGWMAHVIELTKANYGAAMREGFRQANGDWVINFDIDYFSGPFVRGLEDSEADVVIASKRAPGSNDRRSHLRRLATWGFNLTLRTLLRSKITDTHGIKAFRRQVLSEVEPLTNSTFDLFDTELVLRAERMGFQIDEVPIVVEERRAASNSLLKRVPRTLAGVLSIKMQFTRERSGVSARLGS